MDKEKFTKYLNGLEISEIYDLYQLGDEFTQEALEIMEKVALEKDGYVLKKERQDSSNYLGLILVIGMMILSAFINQIFKSLGLLISIIVYVIGFSIYFFSKSIEEKDLSEYEKKIKKLREKKGMSEIIVAIADKDLNKFNELMEMGRNIHKKTKGEWTTLMYAARNNQLEIAKILLENGSDPNEKTNTGLDAKKLAHQHNFLDMKTLLEMY